MTGRRVSRRIGSLLEAGSPESVQIHGLGALLKDPSRDGLSKEFSKASSNDRTVLAPEAEDRSGSALALPDRRPKGERGVIRVLDGYLIGNGVAR